MKQIKLLNNQTYFKPILKIVNVEGERKFKSPPMRYLLLHRLEDIADNYRDLCKYIIKNKISEIDKNIIDYYEKTNLMLRILYDFYYKLDIDLGDKILYEKDNLLAKADDITKKVSKEQLPIFVLLRQIVYIIAEAASPIYTILFDQNQ